MAKKNAKGGVRLVSVGEIMAMKFPKRRKIGNWRIRRGLKVIEWKESGYEIPFESLRTCAGMLDWVFQIANKTTMSNEDVRDFLTALDEVFDPQATMCSFGKDLTAGKKQGRRKV